MKVRELQVLLSRLDPNAEINGHDLAALRVKHNKHIELVRDSDRSRLLRDAPQFYEAV